MLSYGGCRDHWTTRKSLFRALYLAKKIIILFGPYNILHYCYFHFLDIDFQKDKRLPLCQLVDLGSTHVLYLQILCTFCPRSGVPGGFRVPSELGFLDPFPDPQLTLGLSLPPPTPTLPYLCDYQAGRLSTSWGRVYIESNNSYISSAKDPFKVTKKISFRYKSDMG